MQVISHFPKSAEFKKMLCGKLAEVQAESIIERIQKLNLSDEDNQKLINMICERVKFNTIDT